MTLQKIHICMWSVSMSLWMYANCIEVLLNSSIDVFSGSGVTGDWELPPMCAGVWTQDPWESSVFKWAEPFLQILSTLTMKHINTFQFFYEKYTIILPFTTCSLSYVVDIDDDILEEKIHINEKLHTI